MLINPSGNCYNHVLTLEDMDPSTDSAVDYGFLNKTEKASKRNYHKLQKWSNGRLIWLKSSDNSGKEIKMIDFRQFAVSPVASPMIYQYNLGTLTPNGLSDSFFSGKDQWAVGFNTANFLSSGYNALPHIFTWTIQLDKKTPGHYINWDCQFTTEERNKTAETAAFNTTEALNSIS